MTTLREDFLSFNPFRTRTLTVMVPRPDLEGVPQPAKELTVKVKQPTVEQRSAIFSGAEVRRDGSIANATNFRSGALAIIYCVLDPTTDKPIFEIADLDGLLAVAAGGWVDTLAGAVMEVLTEGQAGSKK